jgi:uncharacterized membrane protein YjjP (DUF1212 family)
VEEPPEAVLDFLRQVGVAMCRAGDSADRVTVILDDVARAYAARGVSFFVLPTGVFVRIEAGDSSRVDFAPGGYDPLRLDQIDTLYRLVDDIRQHHLPVADASLRLATLVVARPRFHAAATVLGHGVLTVGLGLMLNPTTVALPVYLVLGLLVGLLRLSADRYRPLDLVFPVATSFIVTWVAFSVVAPLMDAWPLDIVIPSLVTLLPGAALTMATVELSVGSIMSGSARLVYGLQRLLFLTFGIAMGVDLAHGPQGEHGVPMGVWAPWVGVLVFGLGHVLASSAPRGTFWWLLAVLYATYAVQAASGLVLSALGASFVAGAVVPPITYYVQHRRSGPPVMVTFLPAFWMLVPGALGLQGVTQIVGADAIEGLGDFVNALLTIVAIAAGVLVGTGLSERLGRATSTWRGL